MTTTPAAPSAEALFGSDEYRVDGREKVSGTMRYTADFAPANLLWAAYTLSPYAHAKILRIDTADAKQVPGVRAVLTSADIGPNKRFGRIFSDPGARIRQGRDDRRQGRGDRRRDTRGG